MLQDKIEIRLGDALDIKDLSDATVVFLYMGEEFDVLLRPILWKQLKVGTRIVSHRFRMGDWMPDETIHGRATHQRRRVPGAPVDDHERDQGAGGEAMTGCEVGGEAA